MIIISSSMNRISKKDKAIVAAAAVLTSSMSVVMFGADKERRYLDGNDCSRSVASPSATTGNVLQSSSIQMLKPSIAAPTLFFSRMALTAHNKNFCQCEEELSDNSSEKLTRLLTIQRSRTLRILTSKATSNRTLGSLYTIDWNATPIGEGAFGHVLVAKSKQTGERYALKRIPKKLASREDFQREMEALLRIQKWGGHPHICALHEHFDEGGYYYLILDLVEGGEMFDHLVNHGAYSEADAARLVREVTSALDFLHGIGVVHNDVGLSCRCSCCFIITLCIILMVYIYSPYLPQIKPENLMLSTVETRDGSIQLVDFGCAEVEGEDDDDDDHDIDENTEKEHAAAAAKNASPGLGGFTAAYSSPEAFQNRDASLLPPADMWALGVIVYIMLTGVHPFDILGRATDEEIEKDIRDEKKPLPLGPRHPYTRHLSTSARDLIGRLMERDPAQRMSAFEMLHHPWVKGETASTNIMAGSDDRLNKFRKFKTQLQTQFFADAVGWSDEAISVPMGAEDETRRRMSLIERSFKAIDGSELMVEKLMEKNKGMAVLAGEKVFRASKHKPQCEGVKKGEVDMTMSDYHDLLSENMKQKYFPKGHVVYNEGDLGDHMVRFDVGLTCCDQAMFVLTVKMHQF